MTEGPVYQGRYGLKGPVYQGQHGLHGHIQGRGIQLAPDDVWQVQGQIFSYNFQG